MSKRADMDLVAAASTTSGGARRVMVPVPKAFWPRSGDDLATLDSRLGGKTTWVFGPQLKQEVREPDGKLKTKMFPQFVELWLSAEVDARPPALQPTPDEGTAEFLRGVAKVAAKAWINTANRAKGQSHE